MRDITASIQKEYESITEEMCKYIGKDVKKEELMRAGGIDEAMELAIKKLQQKG